ncbi:MAG TPA: DUF2804 family protein [Solirubrobacteraceae bacterium]|jgi:hypothetical protein|nr:DUF2804 family protein [Solirubrobacteraceae bacterium]
MRKRWRYVLVSCERVLLCAADVRVGPFRQSFWAVWDGERLDERTHRRRALTLTADRLHVPGTLDLELSPTGTPVEVTTAHGEGQVWTRKTPLTAAGTLRLPGRPAAPLHGAGICDETDGRHARHTEWWWAAGLGQAADGRALAFNLVRGVGDPEVGSERALWLDGTPHEIGPVAFAEDLSSVAGLRFSAEATRARRENLLVVASEYVAPFGSFAGEIDGVPFAHARGVMEHHRARW